MGSNGQQQLQMLWPERLLESPPGWTMPADYALRTFEPGDEEGYLNLMGVAGFGADQEALGSYFSRVLPDALFFIIHQPTSQIVATAMATHNPSPLHRFGGELGWVAGSPQHAGKGLGKAVCAAATVRLLERGYRRIYLRTDDWRIPAIKTYLRLGYVPFLYAPDIKLRWIAVCDQLDWPFTPDDWPRPLAPDASLSDADTKDVGREDMDAPARFPRRWQWVPHRPHKGYALSGDVDAFGDESLYRPSRLGTAAAEPARGRAGQVAPLSLQFTAGPAGLPEGASVTFVMRGQHPLGQHEQEYRVEGPAECVFERTEKGLGFVLRQGQLSEGQRVSLSLEPFPWTPLAGRRESKVVIDSGRQVAQQRLPEPVVVELMPDSLARLEASLPCTHRTGEPLSLRITARDQYDNRAAWTGQLEVDAGEEHRAPHMVAGAAECTLGGSADLPVRAGVRMESSEARCVSNPSVAVEGLQLYVGDLHCHDFLSEAEGYPDEVYRWAIEERDLDFVSVVPQAHGWLDNETWAITKYMNERYLKEGEFVTLLGFEWQHSGYGDKVVHYLGGDHPYLPVDDLRYNSPGKLCGALRPADALVIGHHPGYPVGQWVPGTDFGSVQTDVERLVELWSMHGSSEGYDPADRPLKGMTTAGGVMAALRKGLRLGFVAGSDTHSGRPGGSAKEPLPYWGGLAGVWAERLTRRDLFRALCDRHTYALTGARIVLKMTVNGALMGSEIPFCDHAELRIDAWTPGEIRQVEVLKNACLLHRLTPDGDECHIQIEDQISEAAFYHCRVTQTDGQLAVCSPVWVG